jgi:hypothetical protein
MSIAARVGLLLLATALAAPIAWPVHWLLALAWPAAWLLLRPWRSDRLCLLGLLVHQLALQACIFTTQPVSTNADTHGYVQDATSNLLGQPSYFPPGYSLWLSAWQAVCGPNAGHATAAAQHLLFAATLALLVDLARRHLPLAVAVAGAVLAGGFPPMPLLPQSILSENLTLVSLVGSLWAAQRSVLSGGRPALAWQLAGGLLLGIGALVRQVPLVVVPPACWLLLCSHLPWRAALWPTLRIGAVAAACVGAMVGWFWFGSGRAVLTTGSSAHLFNRVIHEQHLLAPQGPATRTLLDVLGPERILQPHWDVSKALQESGRDWDQAMALMGTAAREGIWSAPGEFAAYTFTLTWRQYERLPIAPVSRGAEDPVRTQFDAAAWFGAEESRNRRSELDGWLRTIWPFLMWVPCLGFAVALLRSRHRAAVLGLGSIPVTYLFLSSATEFENPRFTIAVLPFAMLFAAAPLVWRWHGPQPANRPSGTATGTTAAAAAPQG